MTLIGILMVLKLFQIDSMYKNTLEIKKESNKEKIENTIKQNSIESPDASVSAQAGVLWVELVGLGKEPES